MAQVELGPDDEPRLPPRVAQFLSSMETVASGTVANLRESWRQPDRPSEPIERFALWNTVVLDEVCERALEIGTQQSRSVDDALDSIDPETRYEVYAAIRMVPRIVLPFKLDLDKLKVPSDERVDERALWEVDQAAALAATKARADRAIGNSELVAKWHSWLWLGDASDHEPDADRGDASMLAIAASRLADNLQTVLGGSQTSLG